MVLTPGMFDFGSVQQGLPGMSKQFTAQNSGQATTAMLLPAMSTADFIITGDTCFGQDAGRQRHVHGDRSVHAHDAGIEAGDAVDRRDGGGDGDGRSSREPALANPALRILARHQQLQLGDRRIQRDPSSFRS